MRHCHWTHARTFLLRLKLAMIFLSINLLIIFSMLLCFQLDAGLLTFLEMCNKASCNPECLADLGILQSVVDDLL